MKIVLASQSPRRRQLLGQMGLEFTTQSPEIDESAFHGRDARDLVETLSREKARWVARQQTPDTLVIGADTVVVLDGAILGKPRDGAEAQAMLAALSGRDHQVFTGVTLCQGDRILTQAEETQVTFRPLTGQEDPPVRLHRGAHGQGRGLWHPGPGGPAGGGHPGGLSQRDGPAHLPPGQDAPGLRRGLPGPGGPLTSQPSAGQAGGPP